MRLAQICHSKSIEDVLFLQELIVLEDTTFLLVWRTFANKVVWYTLSLLFSGIKCSYEIGLVRKKGDLGHGKMGKPSLRKW